MIRIYIVCEGETEETFIRLLKEEFNLRQIDPIATLIGEGKHRGGRVNYDRIYTSVRRHLLKDKNAYCTTFFDYYGLPSEFPGKEKARGLHSIGDKAAAVCDALREKLIEEKNIGSERMRRFIPYVQMHEFEALLFSDPEKLAQKIEQPQVANDLQAIRDDFASPEEINDSSETAPSKRIHAHAPNYNERTKTFYGPQAAQAIGLAAMRRECALFDAWLKRLQALPTLE